MILESPSPCPGIRTFKAKQREPSLCRLRNNELPRPDAHAHDRLKRGWDIDLSFVSTSSQSPNSFQVEALNARQAALGGLLPGGRPQSHAAQHKHNDYHPD